MQFSLRMLFAAAALVGIGAALWVAEPSWQVGAIEVLPLIFLPSFVANFAFNSTGRARAFRGGLAIELLWPALFFFIVALSRSFDGLPVWSGAKYRPFLTFLYWIPLLLFQIAVIFRPVLLAWAFAPIVGLLCVLTHWLLVRPPISNE